MLKVISYAMIGVFALGLAAAAICSAGVLMEF